MSPWQKSVLNKIKYRIKWKYAAAAAKSLQSYPTLCDPIDGSPPGSPFCGILQARILEWVAVPFSKGSPHPRDQTQVSRIVGRFSVVWAMREDFSFENSYNINVGSLNVFPGVSETVLISFHPFIIIIILFHGSDLHHSVFQLTYSSFRLSYSITDFFQCVFHFHYCIVHLLFVPHSNFAEIPRRIIPINPS